MDLLRSLPVLDPLALAQGLQAPPGAPDGPRVVCASAQQRLALRVHIDQLREALRAGWVPDAATRAALSGMARALDAPVEPLLQHVFAGARQADRRDEEEAAQAARYQAFLAGIEARTVMAGAPSVTPARAILGWREDGAPFAAPLQGGHFILAEGTLGSGKSSAATALGEAAVRHVPGISGPQLHPCAWISFFADPTGDSLPELLASLRPNPNPADIDLLARRLGAAPGGVPAINFVVAPWELDLYHRLLQPWRSERLRLYPLALPLPELGMGPLEALFASAADTEYMQRTLEGAQRLGEGLNIPEWRAWLEESGGLNRPQLRRANHRLDLLERLGQDPRASLWDPIQTGALTIFCLAGKWLGQADVYPLIVALLQALMRPCPRLGAFLRFFLFDELNKYVRDPAVMQLFLWAVRQVRHKGSMMMFCGQDWLGLPDELIALATMAMVFRTRSAKIVQHTRERIEGFRRFGLEEISNLPTRTAVVSVAESTDPSWRQEGQVVRFRPLCCDHGGHTRAVM